MTNEWNHKRQELLDQLLANYYEAGGSPSEREGFSNS